jgi:hypothetical protein
LHWEGSEELVVRLPNGFTIVKLKTKEELEYEGGQMGHCIGDGGYDEKLVENTHAYYSLRDSNNRPHATFEVRLEDNFLLECRGKENRAPVAKYIPYVIEFIKSQRFGLNNFSSTGLILQDGEYFSINDLPPNFQFNGDLDLEDTEEPTALPDGLQVKGGVNLRNSAIKKLPKGLKVEGNLTIDGSKVEALGANSYVGGNLTLNRTAKLPEGLHVAGNLAAIGWRGTELPKGLRVDGDLSIQGSNIAKLPNDLHVGGYTDLEGTRIPEIPKGAFFGKGFNLNECSINKLPEDYVYNGDLVLNETTKMQHLPDGLHVKGKLILFDSPINALPQRFRVDGDLVLWRPSEVAALSSTTEEEILKIFPGCNPKRLPNGSFYLGDGYGSEITRLPKDMRAEVGGDLYLPRNRFRELPKGLVVKGKVHELAETPIPVVDASNAEHLAAKKKRGGRED